MIRFVVSNEYDQIYLKRATWVVVDTEAETYTVICECEDEMWACIICNGLNERECHLKET